MKTECQLYDRRNCLHKIFYTLDFTGGSITSDGGGLLLREVEKRTWVLSHFGKCFTDHRNQDIIEHSVLDLVCQRVFGIALGYEDLNDYDELSRDQFFAVMVGKLDLTGEYRQLQQDKGHAPAGKSTLNRLELTPEDVGPESRYHRHHHKHCLNSQRPCLSGLEWVKSSD